VLNLTWKVFSHTGNIETYLLMKEIEKEFQETSNSELEELAEIDSTFS
jgi:hypothetical protein